VAMNTVHADDTAGSRIGPIKYIGDYTGGYPFPSHLTHGLADLWGCVMISQNFGHGYL
jgi:hypothetical protein